MDKESEWILGIGSFAILILFVLLMVEIKADIYSLKDEVYRLTMFIDVEPQWNTSVAYSAVGLYSPDTQIIRVQTLAHTSYESCEIFMHELGHHLDDMERGDEFVYDESVNQERIANEFMDANSWRCEGL